MTAQFINDNVINTMRALHSQPGVVPVDSTWQFQIEAETANDTRVLIIRKHNSKAVKLGKLSPCFDTWKHAYDATQVIGDDIIFSMFEAIHQI